MRWELSEEQELFTTSLREWLGQRAAPAAVRDWLDARDLSSFERLFSAESWAGVDYDEESSAARAVASWSSRSPRENLAGWRRRRLAGCSRRLFYRR